MDFRPGASRRKYYCCTQHWPLHHAFFFKEPQVSICFINPVQALDMEIHMGEQSRYQISDFESRS